jgi:hypothetical protein
MAAFFENVAGTGTWVLLLKGPNRVAAARVHGNARHFAEPAADADFLYRNNPKPFGGIVCHKELPKVISSFPVAGTPQFLNKTRFVYIVLPSFSGQSDVP